MKLYHDYNQDLTIHQFLFIDERDGETLRYAFDCTQPLDVKDLVLNINRCLTLLKKD